MDVPGDALSLELSIIVNDSIDLIIDDLSLESKSFSTVVSDRLTDTQQANLLLLIRMIGYLRFLLSWRLAAKADWQSIEIDAVAGSCRWKTPRASRKS